MAKLKPAEVSFYTSVGESEYGRKKVTRVFLSTVDTDDERLDNLGTFNVSGLPAYVAGADQPSECLFELDPKVHPQDIVKSDMIAAGFVYDKSLKV